MIGGHRWKKARDIPVRYPHRAQFLIDAFYPAIERNGPFVSGGQR
jgi:hypothetical protein